MFEHMLVPLDGSSLAECVLPHTVALAQAFGSRVTLLQVLERGPTYDLARSVDPVGWNLRKAEAEAYLGGWAARLRKFGFLIESRLLEGHAAEQIIEFAHGHDVELIVLSSHGRSGLSGWNISSVVQKIVLRAYIPAMIVRAYQPCTGDLGSLRYRQLLVPLDGSQRAECVLPLVTTLARFHGCQLLLAHLVCRPEIPRRVPLTLDEIELVNELTERNRLVASSYLEKIRSQLSVDVETRLLVSDDITATLHDLVEEEDVAVVVLGAHGYSGRTKWPYGSVALSFIIYGTTPLLIVQDLCQEEVEITRAEVAASEYKGH
jgi:nucleotide-binding universal stress UspA family protein